MLLVLGLTTTTNEITNGNIYFILILVFIVLTASILIIGFRSIRNSPKFIKREQIDTVKLFRFAF